MRRTLTVPLCILLLAALVAPALPVGGQRSGAVSRERGGAGGERWSRTAPPINQRHIFEGETNRRGKPVGFHARPGGRDPQNARLVERLDGPDRWGVYTGVVEIREGPGARWQRKTSTFYPDRMRREEVLAAILRAFQERRGGGEKFRGPSGAGFTIEGYFQNGRINTAYPIFAGR